MVAYRIYTLDDDCVVLRAKVVAALDDEAIVAEAQSMLDDRDLEIWTDTRRVAICARQIRMRTNTSNKVLLVISAQRCRSVFQRTYTGQTARS